MKKTIFTICSIFICYFNEMQNGPGYSIMPIAEKPYAEKTAQYAIDLFINEVKKTGKIPPQLTYKDITLDLTQDMINSTQEILKACQQKKEAEEWLESPPCWCCISGSVFRRKTRQCKETIESVNSSMKELERCVHLHIGWELIPIIEKDCLTKAIGSFLALQHKKPPLTIIEHLVTMTHYHNKPADNSLKKPVPTLNTIHNEIQI